MESPFNSLEGSHEYVSMLYEAIQEARRQTDADIAEAGQCGAGRRRQALLLVAHNLSQLDVHVLKGRRILVDLRNLRRLLLDERRPIDSSEEAEKRMIDFGAAGRNCL